MSDRALVLTTIGENSVPARVALLTLNRPEARNALSTGMLAELSSALGALEANDGVDAVVITGAGTAFCAGLDLKQMAETGANLRPADGRPWPQVTKPTIAAVNGPAITGGLELALSCDFLVASTDAVFADTHTRVGLVPFWGLSVLLPAAIGSRNARFMSLTGRLVAADEALRMGLVVAIVPPADLLPTALAMAADITSADQAATRVMVSEYRRTSISVGALDAEVQTAEQFLRGGIEAEVIEQRRRDLMARNRAAMR